MNQVLLDIRRSLGFSRAAMARYLNVQPTIYGLMEDNKYDALTVGGEWKSDPVKVSIKLRVLVEDIFYNQKNENDLFDSPHYDFEEFKETASKSVSKFPTPENYLCKKELLDVFLKILSSAPFTTREATIVMQYFGFIDDTEDRGHTLKSVSKLHGVQQERIRQIILKALRKMRHHAIKNQIIEYLI